MAILTLEELHEASTITLRCPRLSDRLGKEVEVRMRVITAPEIALMTPRSIPGSEEWPQEGRDARIREYLSQLSPEERRVREREWFVLNFQILATAMIEPQITPEAARHFAEDAEYLVAELSVFSGLTQKTPTAHSPGEPAPAAPSSPAGD